MRETLQTACSFPNTHLIAALRSILQELEADPEALANHSELHNLKIQILATLTGIELRQQAAAAPLPPPTSNTAVARFAELLRASSSALAAKPDPLSSLGGKDTA